MLIAYSLVGCSSSNFSFDYDKKIDFAKYETFTIIRPQKIKDYESIYLNDLNQRRFREQIETELSRKGFTKEDPEKADFGIVYHLRFDKKLVITSYGYTYNYYTGQRSEYVQARVYQKRSLILDIIDRELKVLVWRGAAEGVLREEDNPEEIIRSSIQRMLKKFPPAR